MRFVKSAGIALGLFLWVAVPLTVVVWCVSYLFWGEYRTATVEPNPDEPFCVGTWCTDGNWMRSGATVDQGSGPEPITILGDYEAGMEPDVLVGPLPGLGLPSRFEALLPLILVFPALASGVGVNLAILSSVRSR
ncbi:hypothetical protein [Glycomyces dulcitolivorans]|uniref:hypothetical protein n=1 Tax=Glycomyces dulcitolivorans TaxID=2200759 RepID=UPI000DD3C541|nr:hypothetical protein [Glycomyces dulcitolivorans]